MTTEDNAENPAEAKLAGEKEETKQYVEKLLSDCESNAPRVYVLELLCVEPGTAERTRKSYRSITSHYRYSMWPILVLVGKIAHKVWPGPETTEDSITTMSVAIVADPGKLEDLGLGGESIWLREIESDEVFEAQNRSLLLQPRNVREIFSDFVLNALETRLEENHNDARLAVLHAAGEILMDVLEEDLCLIPDHISEVVQAVDDVLSETDWINLTEAAVKALSSEVVRRVGRP